MRHMNREELPSPEKPDRQVVFMCDSRGGCEKHKVFAEWKSKCNIQGDDGIFIQHVNNTNNTSSAVWTGREWKPFNSEVSIPYCIVFYTNTPPEPKTVVSSKPATKKKKRPDSLHKKVSSKPATKKKKRPDSLHKKFKKAAVSKFGNDVLGFKMGSNVFVVGLRKKIPDLKRKGISTIKLWKRICKKHSKIALNISTEKVEKTNRINLSIKYK
jgi:hypothetical protein